MVRLVGGAILAPADPHLCERTRAQLHDGTADQGTVEVMRC